MYLLIHNFTIQNLEGIQMNALVERQDSIADGGIISQTEVFLRGTRGRGRMTVPIGENLQIVLASIFQRRKLIFQVLETDREVAPLLGLPGTACYRCMFKEPPPAGAVPTCSQAGVLGAIAGMLGTIQAAETLKYFTGIGELLTNRLLTFDAKTMQFRTVPVKHRDSCAICGTNPTIDHLIDYEQAACDLKNH